MTSINQQPHFDTQLATHLVGCRNLTKSLYLFNFFRLLKVGYFRRVKVNSPIGRCNIKSVIKIILSAIIFGCFGCASIERSTLLGAGTGAAMGAVSASVMSQGDHQQSLQGAGIGALVGGITGYILHRVIDNKEDQVRRETLFNLESHGISKGFDGVNMEKYDTFVSSPEVREDFVETHTVDDGRKLIQGHKVWTIMGNPQFNIGSPQSRHKR
jgi:hypothetical protein